MAPNALEAPAAHSVAFAKAGAGAQLTSGIGTKGKCRVHGGFPELGVMPKPGDAYDNQASYFVDCVRKGRRARAGDTGTGAPWRGGGERGTTVAGERRGGEPVSRADVWSS
jgi:hypothetical protein